MIKKTGGSAFPRADGRFDSRKNNEQGMTLRDYFAGQIMQDMFEEFWNSPYDAARFAYKFADAMMKARDD